MTGDEHALQQAAEDERGDGDLSDLLEELRILLPGTTTLTAFLIILPFNSDFAEVRDGQKIVYLITFLCSVLTLILLTAPAAHHRLQRPLLDREGFKNTATRMMILWPDPALRHRHPRNRAGRRRNRLDAMGAMGRRRDRRRVDRGAVVADAATYQVRPRSGLRQPWAGLRGIVAHFVPWSSRRSSWCPLCSVGAQGLREGRDICLV